MCSAVWAFQRGFWHCCLAVFAVHKTDFWWFVGWSFAWRDDLELDFFGGYVGSSVDGDDSFDFPLNVVKGGHEGWACASGDGYAEFEAAADAVCKCDGWAALGFCLVEDSVFGHLLVDRGFEGGVVFGSHYPLGFGAFDFASDFVGCYVFMGRNRECALDVVAKDGVWVGELQVDVCFGRN